MKTWLKRAAWIGAALLLVAVGVGGYLLATFDPNRYQGLLVDWVRQHKQRELTIGAPMSLKLFPRLTLHLARVSLSEHQRREPFLAVDEAELSLQVLPLLQRRLLIDTITVKGVRLSLLRDAQGRTNIDDLLKHDAEQDSPHDAGAPLRFDVAGVKAEDVQLRLRDDKTGWQGPVVIHRFRSGRLTEGRPADIEVDAGLNISKPGLDGAVKGLLQGQLRLTPRLEGPAFDVRQARLRWKGQTPGFEQLEAEVAGDMAWDGARGGITAEDLKLNWTGRAAGRAGVPGTAFDDSQISLAALAYDPPSERLTLKRLAVQIKAKRDGHPATLVLDWPALDIQGQRLQGEPFKGHWAIEGPVAGEGSFESQAPSGSFSNLTIPGVTTRFKLKMAGQGGAREMEGRLLATMRLQPAGPGVSADAIDLALQVREPALQPLQIRAGGRAMLQEGKQMGWALQGRLNDDPFAFEGKADLSGKVPLMQVQARFASLDLNRILPAGETAPPPPASASSPRADGPIDLAGLKAADGRIVLNAGHLSYRQYRLSDVDVQASLDKGRLTVEHLRAAMWRGRVQARAALDANSRSLTTQGTAEGVDVQSLLKDVMGRDTLEGKGSTSWDLHTAGPRKSAWLGGLQGKAAMHLRDGAVHGVNLAKSLREFKARVSGQGDAVVRASRTEKTDFTELSASFTVKNGVAHNDDLSAKSPFFRVGGKGDVDLARQRLDYTVNATVTGTVKGQDGAELEALKGLTVPVQLTGPFDAVDWKIAWSNVALGAAQNTLRSRLEDQLKARWGLPTGSEAAASGASAPAAKPEQALEKKLREQLKGLFK